ncbi:glutathione S-transferase [Enhydrobacter aerosaccus]|uniref:glutathione transferase n=1 Tax=Enhydrobacter aerosaccus TaxID=225324 RepID=A0A1T4JVX8_9HYPH|nr:glutathione S-transferase family protein [Enhydrobacter aerosaccus]SJZ34301.1 glutathione S-transferase [Enhydrobacter aerosaccus]
MTAIKIHGMQPSTFTRTVRMACHEKGIDYELIQTPPGDGVRALNPFGKIPAITHGDFVLYESAAILRYLDRSFAGPKLWPDEARAAALVDQWVAAISDSLLHSAQFYMATRFKLLTFPPGMAQKFFDRTREILPAFERQLGATRFLAGEGVSAADLSFAPIFAYFPDVPELKALADTMPNCQRWAGEIAQRSSFKMTEPAFKPQLAA